MKRHVVHKLLLKLIHLCYLGKSELIRLQIVNIVGNSRNLSQGFVYALHKVVRNSSFNLILVLLQLEYLRAKGFNASR